MTKTLFDYSEKTEENKESNTESSAIRDLKEESKLLKSKILVVDDSEFHISQCVQLLRKIGYTDIDTLDNPIDLIANLRDINPDLILMDTEMGSSMLGFEAASQIKNGKYDKEFAIVGMSMDPSYKDSWLSAGADAFIAKRDFSIGMIFDNIIRNALKKYK